MGICQGHRREHSFLQTAMPASMPVWWFIAGGWYVDRAFIREFPGAQDRYERIGAQFPCSFTTLKRYGLLFKNKREVDPGWAARVFSSSSSSTVVPPVPPVVTSSEDAARGWAARVFSSSSSTVVPPPVPPMVTSSEDVAPPASVYEAGASSELPPTVIKAISKKKSKAIRPKQRRKIQAQSTSSDSDGYEEDGTSNPKPDYVDPCENPKTPGARFLRRYGFLRMRLLPSDVLRLQFLFGRDTLTEKDIETIFLDPALCFTPDGASARVRRDMKKDPRVVELREMVLRCFNIALGGNGLHFKWPYVLASRPFKTTRMGVHRDWPCAHSDLRLAFNINMSPPPRVLYLFSGSHIEGSTVDSLPIGVETGQWEILAWNTTLFHAGPPNASPLWQCTLHGTVSNLAKPHMNPKTNKPFAPSHVRMNLLKQERDIHDSHPAREIKCRAKTDGEEWLWIAQ